MKTSFVSNLAVQTAMRLTIQQSQAEVLDAPQEVTTGSHCRHRRRARRRRRRARSICSASWTRMETLEGHQRRGHADGFPRPRARLRRCRRRPRRSATTLMAYRATTAVDAMAIAKTEVTNGALQIFTAAANTSFNGEFLFSGINTDVKPLADYNDPAAVGGQDGIRYGASALHVGKRHCTDERVHAVADGGFHHQSRSNRCIWARSGTTDWSEASDQTMTSRISASEVVASSTNRQSNGMRKFALASVIASELLGRGCQSRTVRTTVSTAAMGYMRQGHFRDRRATQRARYFRSSG